MAFKFRIGSIGMPKAGDTIRVLETGTEILVTGLTTPDSANSALDNPFIVGSIGFSGFEPTNNDQIDVYWDEGGRYLIQDVDLSDVYKYLQNLDSPFYIGNSSDRLKINVDGTVILEGNSTTWDDLSTSLVGSKLSSVVGTVDYNFDENGIDMSANGDIENNNDLVGMNVQLPHAIKLDSELRLHIHWEQTDSTDREFTIKYRLQDTGGIKNLAWITVVVPTNVNNVFSYTSGTLNQITKLVNIDLTGYSISSLVQMKLTRSDAVAGLITSTFIDFHYEIDSFGSNQEFVK